MTRRRRIGQLGERIAEEYLSKLGYIIERRNYRTREGEIDLVVRRVDSRVFVEVRTRTSKAAGSPEESVTSAKLARVATVAQSYLAEIGELACDWHIAVVAVELDAVGRPARVEIVEDITP